MRHPLRLNLDLSSNVRQCYLVVVALVLSLLSCSGPDDPGSPGGGSPIIHGDGGDVGVDLSWPEDLGPNEDVDDTGFDTSDSIDSSPDMDHGDTDIGEPDLSDADTREPDQGDADEWDTDEPDIDPDLDDGDFGELDLGDPHLWVDPTSLSFDSAGIGIPSRRSFTLKNSGTGVLVISGITIASRSSELDLEDLTFPIRLTEHATRTIEVTYTPVDCRADYGEVVIVSNDSDGREKRVLLNPTPLIGELRISPDPIVFGRVSAGGHKTTAVTLSNTGSCELSVDDLYLLGSLDFDFTMPSIGGEPTPIEPTLPIVVEAGSSEEVFLTYFPATDAEDTGTLVASVARASTTSVDVSISGNRTGPCMQVAGEDSLAFAHRSLDDDHHATLMIENCSESENLTITAIALSSHPDLYGHERFTLTVMPNLDTPLVIAPEGSTEVEVTFSPIRYTPENHPDCFDSSGCMLEDGAFLTIESDDELTSPKEMEVTGTGTDLTCPIAVARARVRGTGDWHDDVDATVRQTLELNGTHSSYPGGTVTAYSWDVVEHPDGSTAELSPTSTSPTPTFYLDMVGTYRFQLEVTGNTGIPSCGPAEVVVNVVSGRDIFVQVWWETPGDTNPNDTGYTARSDMDLHFMHPNGQWNQEPWDCYWMNESPDWGVRERENDNPTLIHSDYEAGPETVILDNAEGTVHEPFVYSVGVYNYNDNGYGYSDVTVQIVFAGHEPQTFTRRYIHDKQFWDVARISWPNGIESIDQLYPGGFPGDGP